MTLLGLRFWSPITDVMRIGLMNFSIFGFLAAALPSILGGASSLIGGLGARKKAKQAEEADYQRQVEENRRMTAQARAGVGRSKFLGSILKAYGMGDFFGKDYFADQNIMNRALDRMGYQGATRHKMGGPGWGEILANAGLTAGAEYLAGKKAGEGDRQGAAAMRGYTRNTGDNFNVGNVTPPPGLVPNSNPNPSRSAFGNFGTGPAFGQPGGAFTGWHLSDDEEGQG